MERYKDVSGTPPPDSPKEKSKKSAKRAEEDATAKALGYPKRVPRHKLPFNSHGQSGYTNGRTYISRDTDGHKVTKGWKMHDMKGERQGAHSNDLKIKIGK